LRGLIWLIVAGALYWALRELLGSGSRGRSDRGGDGEEMVRDPQCGVYVPISSALKKKIKGETVYFCSRECEDTFKYKPGV
jgi:YHS domain-containing protein